MATAPPTPTRSALFAALATAFLGLAGTASAGHGGGRDHALADRLIATMENEISCLVRDYQLEIRGVRPNGDQYSFSSALGYVSHAVGDLRDAFDDARGFSRVHYEFNQVENKFKGADRLADRARISPSTRDHLDSLGSAIASFKRLRSSQYGVGD